MVVHIWWLYILIIFYQEEVSIYCASPESCNICMCVYIYTHRHNCEVVDCKGSLNQIGESFNNQLKYYHLYENHWLSLFLLRIEITRLFCSYSTSHMSLLEHYPPHTEITFVHIGPSQLSCNALGAGSMYVCIYIYNYHLILSWANSGVNANCLRVEWIITEVMGSRKIGPTNYISFLHVSCSSWLLKHQNPVNHL